MGKPVKIWALQIRNDYFGDGMCRNLNLKPCDATRQLMYRRNYLLRRVSEAEWQLLDCQGNGTVESDEFRFLVELTDPRLCYYIHPKIAVPEKALQFHLRAADITIRLPGNEGAYINSLPGVIFELNLSFTGAIVSGTTVIDMESSAFYWEYIFIYRDQEVAKNNLELAEASGLIEFTEAEQTGYYEKRAVKFCSKQLVKSAERYPYELFLTETVRDRKREIMHKLPFPEPGFYLDAPPGVARIVIYV